MKVFIKLLFSLLLGLACTIPAFSQTTGTTCPPQNMKYWSLLVLENHSKEIVQYDLKINDDSPAGYLVDAKKSFNPITPLKQAKGSAIPMGGAQDNSVPFLAFSCTELPINITAKATKNKIETTCKVQVETNGNITANCPSDSFISSGTNRLIFK